MPKKKRKFKSVFDAIPEARRAIRLPEVISKTGLSRSSIYAMEKDGRFPRHFKVGERCSAWWEHEVRLYLDLRAKS